MRRKRRESARLEGGPARPCRFARVSVRHAPCWHHGTLTHDAYAGTHCRQRERRPQHTPTLRPLLVHTHSCRIREHLACSALLVAHLSREYHTTLPPAVWQPQRPPTPCSPWHRDCISRNAPPVIETSTLHPAHISAGTRVPTCVMLQLARCHHSA